MTEEQLLPGYEVELLPLERRLNNRRNPKAASLGGRRQSTGRRLEDRCKCSDSSHTLSADPLPAMILPPANASEEKINEAPGTRIAWHSRKTALLIWLGTLVLGFIPGLVFFLGHDGDSYVREQAREALNWSITALIGYVSGLILAMIMIGVLVILAVGICHLLFCLMGALATAKGKAFRAPFAIRLVK